MGNSPSRRSSQSEGGAVGVAESGNSAVLITLAPGGDLLDRRRIDLTDPGLPTHPHHHEGSWAVGRYLNTPGARKLSLADAVALVERVRASAERGAREHLAALAAAVPVPIASIAIRACPPLPLTTEERILDNRAQTFADSVMYREALAAAAAARGWSVRWYDRERVFRDAASRLGRVSVDAFLSAMGRSIGPPWHATHKLAAAAALSAFGRIAGASAAKGPQTMKAKSSGKLKDGARCKVVGGTHAGKSGIVRDIKTGKTGHVSITVVQSNGVRLKTLAKNVVIALVTLAVASSMSRVSAQGRATTTVTRLYTGADGQSHAEDTEVAWRPAKLRTDLSDSESVKVTGAQFLRWPRGFVWAGHPASKRQYVIIVSGRGQVDVVGGKSVLLAPGRVLLAEDVTGKGHTTRVGPDEDLVMLLVPLAQ